MLRVFKTTKIQVIYSLQKSLKNEKSTYNALGYCDAHLYIKQPVPSFNTM